MSTNVSKQRRKELTSKIKAIHKYIAAAKQDENTRNMLTWLSDIEKEINAKKFGLVFEEHRETIDETLETHTPVLTENKKLFIDNGGQMNFLIEGDNLAALQLLLKTHKEKIDLIYIDPPYNRGDNDFIYDDNKIKKSDGYIHSKWLSFMKLRLDIAKKLLSNDGSIFISIDDNEQANLKLLCDSIFGEHNFAGIIPWRKRTAKTDVPFGISQDFEYILLYARSEKFNAFSQRQNVRKYFLTDDIPNREWRAHDLTTQRTIEERPNSNFTIIDPKNDKEYPVNQNRVWAVTKDTFPKFLAENRIVFPGDYPFLNIEKPQLRYFKDEDEAKALKKTGSIAGVSSISTLLPKNIGMTEDGTIDLSKLFERKVFPFPKPVDLIKYLVQIGTINKKNAIILDFFAGSGTTGQSILKYNFENKYSKRHFILCTNNENSICRDVTYERIKRVIKNEKYEASLKYYKIDYIPISDKLYYEYADELLAHIRELVELENVINFIGNDKIAIVLTDEELDDFVKNINKHKNCRKLYRAHSVLVSGEQVQKIKLARIKVNVIPDYYYGELET
jgi:adenine-specific DNA-methyltransferase